MGTCCCEADYRSNWRLWKGSHVVSSSKPSTSGPTAFRCSLTSPCCSHANPGHIAAGRISTHSASIHPFLSEVSHRLQLTSASGDAPLSSVVDFPSTTVNCTGCLWFWLTASDQPSYLIFDSCFGDTKYSFCFLPSQQSLQWCGISLEPSLYQFTYGRWWWFLCCDHWCGAWCLERAVCISSVYCTWLICVCLVSTLLGKLVVVMAGVFELPHELKQPSSLQMPTWRVILKSLSLLTRLVVV